MSLYFVSFPLLVLPFLSFISSSLDFGHDRQASTATANLHVFMDPPYARKHSILLVHVGSLGCCAAFTVRRLLVG
ncbi:hypothetical protein DL95DRAFT_398941 [Leptodontidium sp. 2 PMI_412]|nr:hypothetical protein DL95DRAFT_398941 [Leptodontidium sp. 2 PMI_412]